MVQMGTTFPSFFLDRNSRLFLPKKSGLHLPPSESWPALPLQAASDREQGLGINWGSD